MGFMQKIEYDSLGRKIKDIDQNGGKTLYSYDENGNLIGSKDALLGEFKYAYDSRNRLVKMTDAAGAETRCPSYPPPRPSWEYLQWRKSPMKNGSSSYGL